ncbi:Uncharacterised protein [Escherichia coli]|nr:Uncharacterised protein [Escherichia coli]
MDDEHLTLAFAGNGVDEIAEKFIAVLVVDANTRFHRHRNRHHIAHRFHAVGNQLRITHQTRTKHAVLHPVRRAADIQVDLIISTRFCQLRTLRQRRRIATAELQRYRMFFFTIRQVITFTVNNRPCSYHFSIQQRIAGKQTQEIAAMSVRPVEHRSNAKPRIPVNTSFFRHHAGLINFLCFMIIVHF